jgi:hypothetical protein
MKFSALVILFVFCLMAYAQASPEKPKPKAKPKGKPKKKHMPSSTGSDDYYDDDCYSYGYGCAPPKSAEVSAHNLVDSASAAESTGLLAILGGVAVACVVAIVAIVRKGQVQHEALPDSSERAVDNVL